MFLRHKIKKAIKSLERELTEVNAEKEKYYEYKRSSDACRCIVKGRDLQGKIELLKSLL
jgi:50S ribosomal subunit-associated GTPase HflX